ncbi:MAG TPA: alpha/beta fold hydrolase, partial [Bacteroidota bacterium]|nr:alpha/beta fold hydrolase [Bacteroidota bacterium]
FSESESELTTTTGSISGTLIIPTAVTTPPLVVIIAGSGPTDRNCNSTLGVSTNAYKMIAEELAVRGIASLRYDKRGIGKSAQAMGQESDLRFETYAHDAAAWIMKLRAEKRFSRIIILGHSEGSLLGMLAARKAEADAFISVSGVGRSADKILLEQLSKLPPALLEEARSITLSLKSGKTVSVTNANLAPIFRPSVQPYIISWMKYDPALEITKLSVPVLILQGTNDLQVGVEDAKLLSAASPKAVLRVIEGMNHVLKDSPADAAGNIATYRDPSLPLKKGLVDEIVQFILKPVK